MSNMLRTTTLLACLAWGLTTGASANLLSVQFNEQYRTEPGGEFTINFKPTETRLVDSAKLYDEVAKIGDGFQTFCIQRHEGIAVYTFSYQVSAGAISADGTVDPLSLGTAWLYSQFARGTLDGYDYTPGAGRQASALALQRAIWALEDEFTKDEFTAKDWAENKFLVDVSKLFDAPTAASKGEYGVAALNLGQNGGAPWGSQDQLVLVPDGGATVALLGLALVGVSFFRRRSRRA